MYLTWTNQTNHMVAYMPAQPLNDFSGKRESIMECLLYRFERLLYRATLVLATTIFLTGLSGCSKPPQEPPPPPVVEVVPVIQKDVPIYYEWIGTTDGFVNATIRAQVQGYLISQKYKEGDIVKKGQILFEIDPRTFAAALEQAKGQLAQQQARWTTAKSNLARIKPLADENAVSKKDLDDAIGIELSARASVIAAQAAVDKARLELSFTKIRSPINGIAGIAKAQIGNLVGPATTEELTTVSDVDPIKVYVALSEQQYLQTVERSKESEDPARRKIQMFLADGSLYPHAGRFYFADRQVDPKTGTIRVAATFENPRNALRPGLFARVRVEMGTKKGALLVPQRSVSELQGIYRVAVVGPDNKVEIRPVKVSETIEKMRVVDEGLKPGEQVVLEGVQKVRQGVAVTPKPYEEKPAPAAGEPQAKPDSEQPQVKPAPEQSQPRPSAEQPPTKPASGAVSAPEEKKTEK